MFFFVLDNAKRNQDLTQEISGQTRTIKATAGSSRLKWHATVTFRERK
jgi:hypothetical protein